MTAVTTSAMKPVTLPATTPVTTDVSLLRLYMLRATYLIVAVGLGLVIWPGVVHHAHTWTMWRGVACSLLGAVGLLALLGLRYPLKMLPLLLFELLWKAIWLIAFALPTWTQHRMDPDTLSTAQACLLGVIFPIVIPWRYVFETYVKARGDRWR